MGKYVGIDLGTTISAIAYIDDNGQPQLIPNPKGDKLTPSTVLFKGDKAIVGESAKEKSISDPRNYAAFVKREMGNKNYRFTSKSGEVYNAETISSIILKQLKENAEAFLGEEISGAVITVPAYFGDPHRKATRDAADLAGIKVLDIINEPTAAAIAFGVSKNIQRKQRILVFDFGGGTFDVSILDIDSENITVVATNGDHKLGGYDIDKALADYIKAEAEEAGFRVDGDVKALQQIMLTAEKAKKDLSFQDTTEISVYIKGEEFSLEIDRDSFEEITEDIIGKTLGIMEDTMSVAKLSYSDIDKILLVGGSTRIPLVREEIERYSDIKPSSEVHPDEAVAIGAAFHALDVAKRMADGTFDSGVPEGFDTENESLEIDGSNLPDIKKSYSFQDVTSHGIGVVVGDSVNSLRNSVIIKPNTPIPVTVVSDDYRTAEKNQTAILLQITQGDFEDLRYVRILGESLIPVEPRPYLVPLRISVICASDGIIHVTAEDLDKDEFLGEVKVNREKFNMTDEELDAAKNQISRLDIGN